MFVFLLKVHFKTNDNPMKFLKNPSHLLLCFLLLISLNTKAQEPEKFGKVTNADLEMTVYDKDSSAAAVILFDKGDLKFDFNKGTDAYVFTRHRRIKILKRSAFDYGDIELSYYTDGEELNSLKAMVHNPDGSSEKLDRKDFYREDYNDNWSLVKFSFPNLQEGSIIEYEYDYYSPYIARLPDWYFQHDIPVRWSEFNLHIPEWYSYTGISQGRMVDINERDVSRGIFSINISRGASSNQRATANLNVYDTHLVTKDVPAIKEESYITNMDDYRARIRYQLQSTAINGSFKPYMTDWLQLSQKLTESDYFGGQLSNKRNFKDISEAIAPQLAKAENEFQKAQIIYDHINATIDWNEQFGIYASNDLFKCYDQKLASGAEMNLLLLGMLQQEGIKAYPLLVSTRDHGKMLELYPIMDQFNHTMVMAVLDGNEMVLDQGNRYRPIGTPRSSALNGNIALLVAPAEAQWIQLPSIGSKSVQMAKVEMDENGHISGSFSELRQGYSAMAIRNALESEEAQKLYKESMVEAMPDIEIKQVSVADEPDISKPYKSEIEFRTPNSAIINGDFIYFSPILFKDMDENPFKLEKREYPVDFNYPLSKRFILIMELPEGYALEETPEEINIALPERAATFSYKVQQIGSRINVNYTLEVNKTIFQPEEYETLKKFFDLVVEKQTEQLVLLFEE